MIDSIDISSTNSVFCTIIVAVAIAIIVVEVCLLLSYKQRNYSTAAKAIEILDRYEHGYIKVDEIQKVDKTVVRWLTQYLKGESTPLAFKPEKSKSNDFILLSYPTALSKPVPKSPVSFAPALLTALGILGTFWGISSGLQGVDLDNINESQQLIEASQELLTGMKTAFSTSLAGLIAAIVFMLLLFATANIRASIRNDLRKKLSDIAFIESSNHLLSRLDNEADKEVANTLQDVANSLSGFNADAIAEAVRSAIASPDSLLVQELKQVIYNTSSLSDLTPKEIASANQESFKDLIDPLTEEIKQLRVLQESQGQTVESLVRQLHELHTKLIEPVVLRLDQSAELTKEASAAVTALKDELGGISKNLAGAVITIQDFQKDTLTRLQEFAGELRDILGEFRTDTRDVLQDVASEINRAVEQSIQGMEQQRTIFKENADKVSATFQNIHGIIRDANKVVQGELRDFRREYQEQLKDFLGDQHHELQTIVEQIGKVFQEDVEKRKRLIAQIEQSMDKVQQTVKATSNLANAIGLSDSQRLAEQQEFFREIGRSANQVTKQYSEMVDRFDEALEIGYEQLSEYLKKAEEAYGKRLKDADNAAAEVCTRLKETSDGLKYVVECLVATDKDLKNSSEGN